MNPQQEIQISMTVLLTGLVVVFSVLIFLTFVIKGYGTAVHTFLSKSAKKPQIKESVPESVLSPAEDVPKAIASVSDGDEVSEEIIAVISAAVAAMFPSAAVTGIRKASARPNRSAWSMAGLQDRTRPF